MTDLTDAAFRAQRARVGKMVRRWKAELGLEQWHIEHEFFRGQVPGEADVGGWSGALARGWPDHRYMQAKIQWSMGAVADESDEDLQRHVIHELTHCLTDCFKRYAMREVEPGTSMGPSELERQVTEIEHAITFAYEAGVKDGKRAAKVTAS